MKILHLSIMLLLLSSFVVMQNLPTAGAHGICTGMESRYVKLDGWKYSSESAQTGQNVTITGRLVGMWDEPLQARLLLYSDPGPHGRWQLLAANPSGKFVLPGNSVIPYSVTARALLPGMYFLQAGVEIIGKGFTPLNDMCPPPHNFQVTGGYFCPEGMVGIVKAEDGSPACVTSDTARKLIERGWAANIANYTTQLKPAGHMVPPYENATGMTFQPLVPLPIPPPPPGNLPINYSALAYAKIPNWNTKFECEKYTGGSIQITGTISNALNFSALVTDPKGVTHDVTAIKLNNTQMQVQFSAPLSYPDGSYVTAFKVVNGSKTSNVNYFCEGSMIGNGTIFPALHPVPP